MIASRAIPEFELNIDQVAMSGQAFRWRLDSDDWWISPIHGRYALRLRRDGSTVYCQAVGLPSTQALESYFRLDVSLKQMRDSWADSGELELVSAIDKMPGLRIVRQDPVECLISFLCSSAAPIHRIRRSVDGLCKSFGRPVDGWDGPLLNSFPELEQLASVERSTLDQLGLGFRGRYVTAAAREVLERGGAEWLKSLRNVSYGEAKENLVSLPGVGEKVADCICLFSLDKDDAVPIDVQIARVARRLFPEFATTGSLTARTYELAGRCFRERFGKYAGWAQQYFFFNQIAAHGLWDQNISRHRPKAEMAGEFSPPSAERGSWSRDRRA